MEFKFYILFSLVILSNTMTIDPNAPTELAELELNRYNQENNIHKYIERISNNPINEFNKIIHEIKINNTKLEYLKCLESLGNIKVSKHSMIYSNIPMGNIKCLFGILYLRDSFVLTGIEKFDNKYFIIELEYNQDGYLVKFKRIIELSEENINNEERYQVFYLELKTI